MHVRGDLLIQGRGREAFTHFVIGGRPEISIPKAYRMKRFGL